MKKILAIDDQLDNLTTIKAVLKNHLPEYTILTALSGKEGIDIARKEQPDTILLDIIMPKMDGYEVCEKLKNDELTKHIPVVMITAIKTDIESRVKGLNIGADAFFSKPIDPVELSAQVKVMLRIKEAEDKLRVRYSLLNETVKEKTDQLIEQEEQFRLIAENTGDNISITTFDLNAKYIYVSPSIKAVLGYEQEDLLGKSFFDFIHPDDKKVLFPLLKKYVKNKINNLFKGKESTITETIEYRFRNKQGEWRILQSTINIAGKNLLSVTRDITRQKNAEEKLRNSEERYQSFIRHSREGIYRMEMAQPLDTSLSVDEQVDRIIKDAYIAECNDAFVKMYDAGSMDQILGTRLADFHSGAEESGNNHIRNFIHSGYRLFNAETLEKTRKGEMQWFSNQTIGIVENGFLVRMWGTQLNITDKKIANAKLVDSRNQYESLFNQIADPILVFDQKTRLVLKCNNAMIEKYGYSLPELMKMTTLDLHLEDEDRDAVHRNIDDTAQNSPNHYQHKAKDGTVFTVETHTQEVVYDGKDAWLTIIRDITEQQKASMALEAALVKATESDRLKSAFLATMSHELRTPLNAIIGFSDLINQDLSKEEIITFVKTINMSGNHLLNIVEDLFDITLIEAGEIKIHKSEEKLDILLQDVYKIISNEQVKLGKSEIDLRLSIKKEDKNTIISTDHSKLKQILLNLLKNALKFTSRGLIEYGFEKELMDKKPMLKFFVRDHGIGITKANQDLIFEAFRQVDDSNTRAYGGTGIGLSISKKMTEILGGQIWVESEVGKGSTFYFTLPYLGPETEKQNEEKIPLNDKKMKTTERTILVVEDDESSYQFLETILKRSGFQVLLAKNGLESVNICKQNQNVDLVLMDINMPVMNGYEATKEIKKLRPELPIIAQTAYAIAGDRQKALDHGCDEYVSKPIVREELIKKINQFLSLNR